MEPIQYFSKLPASHQSPSLPALMLATTVTGLIIKLCFFTCLLINKHILNFIISYLIQWTVFSQSSIKSYDLRIREVDHSTNRRSDWRHIPVTPINDDQGPVRKQSYRVDNLSQFNGYEIDLEVENELGKTRYDNCKFIYLFK